MDHTHSQHSQQTAAPPFWRSRYALGFLVFGAIAAYFLLSEHRAHFIGALPFLLLLSCPLMHIFMHHGHGGKGGDHQSHGSEEQSSQKSLVPPTNDTGERP